MSIPGGAGGIVSTPEDLIQFIDAVFANKLTNKISLDEMIRLEDNFGQGIFMSYAVLKIWCDISKLVALGITG